MKKRDLMKALEEIDDDGVIYVLVDGNYYCIKDVCDVVTGCKLENEITLVCE